MALTTGKENKAASWRNFVAMVPRVAAASRWLPVVVGVGISTATLFVWQALIAQEHAQIKQMIQVESSTVKDVVAAQLTTRTRALVQMAKRWETRGGTPKREWEADAMLFVNDYSGYQAVEWVDPSFHVRWIVPLAGNEAAKNLFVAREPRKRIALEAARNRHEVILTRSISLVQGGKGFLAYVPIFQGKDFRGFIVGVFRAQRLLDAILQGEGKVSRGYSITVFDGGDEIYSHNTVNRQHWNEWGQETKINLYGVTWRVRVWPTPQLLALAQSPLSEVVLVGGLLMAWLLALAVHLAQRTHQKQQQAEATNLKLESEITLKKRTEAALRESEERFNAFMNNSPAVAFIKDSQGRFVYINEPFERCFNIRMTDWLGKTDFDVWPLELAQQFRENDRAVLAADKPLEIVEAVPTPDGCFHHWLSFKFPFQDKTGQRLLGGVAIDITERQQAEAALQQVNGDLLRAQKMLQLVMDLIPQSIWWKDRDSKYLGCNRNFAVMVGVGTPDNLIGKTDYDIWTKSEADFFRAGDARVMAQNHAEYGIVEPASQKNGTLLWLETNKIPLLDEEGRVIGTLGTSHDITERKEAEVALQNSEKKYRSVVDNVKEVIFQTDAKGNWTFLNPAWEEITGFSIPESLGTLFLNYIHPDDCQRNWEQFQPLIDRLEQYCRYETRYLTKNGGFRTFEVYARLTLDTDENITGTSGTLNDITERKQAELAFKQANEKLTAWVNELEQRNREIALLGEMSEVLQACLTVEEAYTAIATLVQPLFPQSSGGIFAITASKNLVEAVATWGETPFTSEKLFTPDECWALRRGRAHRVDDAHKSLVCRHIHQDSFPTEALCIPMMAQGEAIGVLYLSSLETGRLTETKQQLALTVAEHIALSLANLKLRHTLKNQSIRDPLTGLFNRRYMEESLEREMHRCTRKQQPLSIIMLDVDHFKRFNDTFGHEAGDAVLRELGQFLQKNIRLSDIACRYGGEELTLILPEASLEIGLQRAEQLRSGAKHLSVQHDRQLLGAITLSLGVACFPEYGLTGEAVIRAESCRSVPCQEVGARSCRERHDFTRRLLIHFEQRVITLRHSALFITTVYLPITLS